MAAAGEHGAVTRASFVDLPLPSCLIFLHDPYRSARRSRLRKQQHLDELVQEVARLQAKNACVAVLRVSLGNFLFFTILAVIMAGIKDQKDPRDKIHHGGLMAKIFWFVIVFLMFFVPNGVVSFYESISKFGSGYSFWFMSFFCWNLWMDGMRTGLPRMSSSGTWHRWFSQLVSCLLHCHIFFLGSSLSLVHPIWT